MLGAIAGAMAVLLAVAAIASGWTLPTLPALPNLVATSSPGIAPTATTAIAVAPSSSPLASPKGTSGLPTPAPTLMPNGCMPPPADVALAPVISHGPRTKKVVALTFDDGTNPNNVHRILGILYSAKVNATFFPTGRSVQLAPDVWKHVAETRYPVANHTYSHQSLKGLCFQPQLAELLHDERVLEDTGVTMLPVMRPPYEEFDSVTRIATSAAGESHVVLWDVDTEDWTGVSTRTIVRRAVAGKPGSIILMHTGPVNTARALRSIISRYRARGFTFVTVGQLIGIGGPVPFP